jgi:hypothetical protein
LMCFYTGTIWIIGQTAVCSFQTWPFDMTALCGDGYSNFHMW